MPFINTIPKVDGTNLEISLNQGEILFILGANGTGKSGLMHKLYTGNQGKARRINANRQIWLNAQNIGISPGQRASHENYILNFDSQITSRWTDDYATYRSNIALFDLVEAENARARLIADAVDGNKTEEIIAQRKNASPIKIINEIFHLSNLAIEVLIQPRGELFARKLGSTQFSIAELSDGERNALLIAASVLTVDSGTLLLIDEPERHLHRSIISPLLSHLFSQRPDCCFIVSTHDVMLPIDNPSARTLLIRNCSFSNSNFRSWDADLISPELAIDIDDDLKKDILGARRKILFIEGAEQSLDKPLYSLIFPNVSIIAKSSCRDVEYAVRGIREANDIHWIQAYGIIDSDLRPENEIDELKKKGIYATPFYSVESVYYHPEIQRRVAARHSSVTGADVESLLSNAKTSAIAAIKPHSQRLSELAAEKTIRAKFFQKIPNKAVISSGDPIEISIDVAAYVAEESKRFQDAISAGDFTSLMERYPVRETSALDTIASRLGFQGRKQYERAVLKLIQDHVEALMFVKKLFDSLSNEIDQV